MTNSSTEEHSVTYRVTSIAFNFLVCALVTFNNTLLLVTLAKTRKLRTLTNAYIASLAVADLLVGITLFCRHFWLIPSTEWFFNENKYACLPIICLMYVSAMQSIASLVLVSVDRYAYIVHPFWYERNVTPKTTKASIFCSWMVALTLGSLPMWLNSFSPETGCAPMTMISKNYLLYCLTLFLLLAASGIVCMYARILYVGNKHRRQIEVMAAVSCQQQRANKEKNRWQIIRFLMLVCGLFFMCWLPLVVTVVIYFTVGVPSMVITVTVSIAGVNSGMNFVVLLVMNKVFKESLIKLLKSWFPCCGFSADTMDKNEISIQRSFS